MRIFGLREVLAEHILRNRFKYILILVSLITGVIAGAFLTLSVSYEKSSELAEFVRSFCADTLEGGIPLNAFVSSTLFNNFRLFILFLLCSLHVFLVPLIFFSIAVKGFVIGFSTCFMCVNFGFWGFLLIAFSNIIQIFLLIPVCMYMAVQSVNINKRRSDFLKSGGVSFARTKIWSSRNYVLSCIFCVTAIFVCSVVEAAVVPGFVRAVAGFL